MENKIEYALSAIMVDLPRKMMARNKKAIFSQLIVSLNTIDFNN